MPRKPNIVWILTTQWRAQAAGYAGDSNARTPQLDALAQQSTWFSQAVTPHPFGPFARAALLTGDACPANGVRDYFDPLPATARTIAHTLAECGYATAYFGKWHLARRDPDAPLVGEAHARMIVPEDSRGGFSHWVGFESGFLLNDPWLHGSGISQPQRFAGYQSDVLCAHAAAYITEAQRRPADQPWFAVVSLEAPHPPYSASAAGVVPPTAAGLSLRGNVPLGGEVEAKARHELSGYYAHIEATDRALGRFVDAVDRDAAKRAEPPPILVFTSVHGDMHGSHGLFRKGWPHEESIRIPLLVRRPGQAPGVDDRLVSLLDLPYWTGAWAEAKDGGARTAAAFQRLSMPSVVALPHQCDRGWQAVRTHRHKLVVDDQKKPWLYFDLGDDPLELDNRIDDAGSQTDIDRLQAWL